MRILESSGIETLMTLPPRVSLVLPTKGHLNGDPNSEFANVLQVFCQDSLPVKFNVDRINRSNGIGVVRKPRLTKSGHAFRLRRRVYRRLFHFYETWKCKSQGMVRLRIPVCSHQT